MLLNAGSKILIHGFGSAFARIQTQAMQSAGTRIVAGVSVGGGGTSALGVPIFDTVAEAVKATAADTAAVYVPARGVRDALVENADAGIRLAFVTAEHVPLHDALFGLSYARQRDMWVVGPNSVGMNIPGVGVLGSVSQDLCTAGNVAVLSRSGTLTLIIARTLNDAGIGQRACIHVGGDQICGRNPIDYLDLLRDDPATKAIVYCGELGGAKEYAMVEQLAALGKPLIAMIVGRSAPPGKRMGHAGAMAGAARETAQAKREALASAGAFVADHPAHVVQILAKVLA